MILRVQPSTITRDIKLDREAEERRKLTVRLVDHTAGPKRVSFWQRLFDQLRS